MFRRLRVYFIRMKHPKPELLSPAGNLETALAAFDGGADAVYCGLGRFNARERAANFTPEELGKLLEFARGKGKKVYLTFNTLLKESELSEAARMLAEIARLEPDALIVQDLGVIELCRKYFPMLTLHGSTQMGIHNSAGIAVAARLGLRRVILERQVTLEELRRMAAASPVELEVFTHGSLCCSLSGRCLLSSAFGGASGNRGKCKQPCRRRYRTGEGEGFHLSPADLGGLDLVEEFSRIGIASLKIEGRLRSPDYVWKTARAYRLILDSPEEGRAEAERLLASAATRILSPGFYRPGKLVDPGRIGVFGTPVGVVEKTGFAGIAIRATGRLHLGDRLRLVPADGGDGDSFTLIHLAVNNREAVQARSGERCFITGSFEAKSGMLLYKIGENGFDFSRQAAALPPGRQPVKLHLEASAAGWRGRIEGVSGEWRRDTAFGPARNRAFEAAQLQSEFASGVPEPWRAKAVEAMVEGAFFVPASELKELRRDFWQWAATALEGVELRPDIVAGLEEFLKITNTELRIPNWGEGEWEAVPGFIPEGELEEWRERIRGAYRRGVRRFAVGGIHGFDLVPEGSEVLAAFPLPVANSLAAKLLQELGAVAAEPSVELDREALAALEAKSPIPLVPHTGEVPLLVTRTKLVPGEWRDGRGNRFRVCRGEGGLYYLFAAEPVSVSGREWL